MGISLPAWLTGLRSKNASAPDRRGLSNQVRDSKYHAVSVRPGNPSCQAAVQLGRLRFLSRDAPKLPLPECTAQTCTCRYAHYADRRSGLDRRRTFENVVRGGMIDRRLNHGRRSTDAIG